MYSITDTRLGRPTRVHVRPRYLEGVDVYRAILYIGYRLFKAAVVRGSRVDAERPQGLGRFL